LEELTKTITKTDKKLKKTHAFEAGFAKMTGYYIPTVEDLCSEFKDEFVSFDKEDSNLEKKFNRKKDWLKTYFEGQFNARNIAKSLKKATSQN